MYGNLAFGWLQAKVWGACRQMVRYAGFKPDAVKVLPVSRLWITVHDSAEMAFFPCQYVQKYQYDALCDDEQLITADIH